MWCMTFIQSFKELLNGMSMACHKILVGVFLLGVVFSAHAQTEGAVPAKNHRWTLYGGIGPNYYFNNLELGKNKVSELNYSFVTRLMWEPEYFLSLGLETGYNRLYSLDADIPKTHIHIVNVAIPIQLVISMKFLKNYYCNFNMGQAFLMNNVTTSNAGTYHASVLSLGDFAATVGYRKKVSDRFFLGTELKAYYSAKLDDKNLSLLFMTGYRLW